LSKTKNESPLVESVIALDGVFSNLIQLAERIDGLNLRSQNEFELAESLLARFSDVGASVATELGAMSLAMNEARARAEAAAEMVSAKALKFQERKNEIELKMAEFHALGEKVKLLTSSLVGLRNFKDESVSDEERSVMSQRLVEVETQLRPLIEEANQLKTMAQESKIKVLEQGADAMGQSLRAVSLKISTIAPTITTH
jgi:hypothetical protein